MKLSIPTEIAVELTPIQLAEAFAGMNSEDQVIFLNHVAIADKKGWSLPWCFQLEVITREPDLSPHTREWMTLLGEYAKASK